MPAKAAANMTGRTTKTAMRIEARMNITVRRRAMSRARTRDRMSIRTVKNQKRNSGRAERAT